MFLTSIFNFFSNIREGIVEILNQDGEIVDVSMGRMTLEEVIEATFPAAKEKEFVNDGDKPSLTADQPTLFHYTRKEQLVWSVYFTQYFTEEEINTKYKGFGFKSITFAVVKIDDATGEIILADWIRPHFNCE